MYVQLDRCTQEYSGSPYCSLIGVVAPYPFSSIYIEVTMKEVDLVKPKYQVIIDDIKSHILSGTYTVGEQIPTESALQDSYNVSRQTVRKAILELSNEGFYAAKRDRAPMSVISTAHGRAAALPKRRLVSSPPIFRITSFHPLFAASSVV